MNIPSRYLKTSLGVLAVSLFLPSQGLAEDEVDIFELSPFEVQSRELEGYIASTAVSATMIDTPIRNLPLTLDVVTRGMIEDYGARTLREMVELSGNITASDKPNTLNVQFILRGFDTYVNMRNGMSRIPNVYGSNVQRVEIVRGPTAVLYGITDPAGAVNVITRRPTAENYTSLQYTYGSYDYNLFEMEWNHAFGEENNFLSRIDASVLDRGGFRDNEKQKTRFISTSNLLVLSPSVSIAFEGEYRDLKDTPSSWWPRIQEAATNTFKMADMVPSTFNANVPGHYRHADSFVGTATLNVRISDNAFYRGSYNHYNRNFTRFTADSTQVTAGRFLSRFMQGREEETTINSLYNQLNVNLLQANYDLRLVFGYEYKDSEVGREDRRTDGGTAPPAWDLTNPDSWDLSVPNVEDLMVVESVRVDNIENEVYTVAHLTFGSNEQYSVLGGLRYSDLKTTTFDERRNETLDIKYGKWSHQIGSIYRPVENFGIYANYSESFRTITNQLRRNPDRTLSPFDPIGGTGKEIGIKLDALDDTMAFNVAFYEIEQTGVRRVVRMEDDAGDFQVDTQSGRERSRGVDFTMNWNIRRNWQVIASIAYNDAKTISNEQAPEFEGRMLPNTPSWMTHLSTRYSFRNERLRGLTVGATWRYVDDTLAYNTVDDFFLKGFHVVNAFAQYRYDIRPNVPVIFRLNVTNLFDEFYFPDTSGPGQPRTVRFSTMIKF